MIKRDDLINLFILNKFIVTQSNDCYTIRAPDWMDPPDFDKEIQDKFLGNKCEIKCTINHMLLLAVKTGILIVDD